LKTVYYGPIINHPFILGWEPLEPLIKNLKNFHTQKTDMILGCPSYAAITSNSYAVKAPCDLSIEIKKGEEGIWPHVYLAGGIHEDNGINIGAPTFNDLGASKPELLENVCQFLQDSFLLMFSDAPLELEITPPFLHHGKLFGVAGSFDIGQWFRPLSFSTFCFEDTVIKKGEPIAYIKFKEKIDLKEVRWPIDCQQYSSASLNYKFLVQKQSLSKMYQRFKISKLRKSILEMAEHARV